MREFSLAGSRQSGYRESWVLNLVLDLIALEGPRMGFKVEKYLVSSSAGLGTSMTLVELLGVLQHTGFALLGASWYCNNLSWAKLVTSLLLARVGACVGY